MDTKQFEQIEPAMRRGLAAFLQGYPACRALTHGMSDSEVNTLASEGAKWIEREVCTAPLTEIEGGLQREQQPKTERSYRTMDAIEQWNVELEKLRAQGLDANAAVSRLVKERPELHRAYLAEYNAQHGRPGVVR